MWKTLLGKKPRVAQATESNALCKRRLQRTQKTFDLVETQPKGL